MVKDINLSLAEGEVLAIVGESGSGKTTILKAIASLAGMEAEIYSGSISYRGRDMRALKASDWQKLRGTELAMVFQHAGASLVASRRIREQVIETVCAHRDINAEDIDAMAAEVFASVGLSDVERIMNAYPFELSGGMAQRVAIALAVILKPKLLLADEPTSALDATIQKQVVEELLALKENLCMGILLITHHIGVARYMADNIAVMRKGVIVEYGSAQSVLNNPQHEYTKALLAAVPKILTRDMLASDNCILHNTHWHQSI